MSELDVRIRKEDFGYVLAFRTGEIGFYDERAAALLLSGASQADLERYRLRSLPVRPAFHLRAPLIVWFEITRSCNLPCRHCYVSAGPPRKNELTTPEIFRCLEELRQAGVFALVLVGGEPMLHPDFIPILQRAHELGFVISIATNGTYITPELIDQLPRTDCIVSVSVDGTQFHRELRVHSSFDQVKTKLLLLKRNGIPAAIMATQTDQNLAELEEVFAFARDNAFFFGTTPFSPIGRGRAHPEYVPGEDVAEGAARLYIRDKAHDVAMMSTVGLCVAKFLDECHRVAKSTRREFCGVAMAYILSDGTVFPCSICASADKYRAGNLRNRSFGAIWDDSFKDIRAVTFDSFKDCPSCELSLEPYYCSSRCPVMAELYTGDTTGCGSTPYLKSSLKKRTALLVEGGYTHTPSTPPESA
jgi:radical SAM protein with 4Fe4S-binding SPASM domain